MDTFGRHTHRGALNFWVLQIALECILVGASLTTSIVGLAKDDRSYLVYGVMMTAIGILCLRGSIRNLRFTRSL
jgi:hypothetical protein